jgi:hypothetical protein
MDLGAILLILAVAVLVGMYISRPFASRRASSEPLIRPAREEVDIRRSSLLAERDRVLTALQDLEFDYTLGKIPAEDYPVQRAELFKAGAEALRELDEISGVAAAASAEARLEAVVAARRADAVVQGAPVAQGARSTPASGEDDIEAMIAARRARPATAGAPAGARRPPASGEDDIEAMVAARRKTRQEKAGGFCPKCGRPVAKSDSFCSRCGAHL